MDNNEKFSPLPIRVLNDLVWLEPEDPETMSFSGRLVLPPRGEAFGDDGKRPPIFARVVAVGPGRRLSDGRRMPMSFQVGDRVLVGAYEGAQLEWRGRKFLVAYEIAPHAIELEGDDEFESFLDHINTGPYIEADS